VTLADVLDRAALRRPGAVAVGDGPRRLTDADLRLRAARVGLGLARLGVGKGDRVLIALRNRLEHVLAYWAVQGGSPMSEFLRVERAGAVATIWIDRQAKMNTMTVAMRNEFPGLFGALEADEAVRVIVVRGAGGKAFSAGGDVGEFLTLAPADLELWGDTLTAAERCRKPVIAAIDGYTMGAGLELAVACDFRIATRRSEFAFPEVRLGMIPGSGGTQRALRLMGMTRGKLFMMTGRRISAEQAEAWSLITEAVPNDKLDEAVAALAGELAERAPLALRTLKMVLNRGAEAPLETALELERKAYAWLRSTHDYAEGVTSFLEKRPPKYTGR